jgi:hypothetical protein
MMDTTMVRAAGMPARSSVDEGATAVMRQITGDVQSGQYYNGLQPSQPAAQANDAAVRGQLRKLSVQLTGVK